MPAPDRAAKNPNAVGDALLSTSPAATAALNRPAFPSRIESAEVTANDPDTSSVAPAPNTTPAGFIRYKFAPAMSHRSAPLIVETDPPVTRDNTFRTDPAPLNVADSPAWILKSEKE